MNEIKSMQVRKRLQQIFNRRASTFHEVDFLLREVSQRMQERLAYIKLMPARILDMGCGNGRDLLTLKERFLNSQIVGIDLSFKMLKQSSFSKPLSLYFQWFAFIKQKMRRKFSLQKINLIEADFSETPFKSNTFDFIWSNLALHWHTEPETVFNEWQRLLNTDGLLMFSTFGPDTLRELKQAWQSVQNKLHSNASNGARPLSIPIINFTDMHDIGDMLMINGFEAPVMDMEIIKITYKTPKALMNDLRKWGAYPYLLNKNSEYETKNLSYPKPLLRYQYNVLLAELENLRDKNGVISVTFEIVYGHAWKKLNKKTLEGDSIVHIEEISGRRTKRI